MADEFQSALVNPTRSNDTVQAILEEANAEAERMLSGQPEKTEVDLISAPEPTKGKLLVGVRVGETVARDFEVRELTGAHEERLSKIHQSDFAEWVQTLLECGVKSIAGEKPTKETLQRLLIGDRDALVLAIRRATFGEDVVVGDIICPECNEQVSVTVRVSDVPVTPLDGQTQFDVPLKNNYTAVVRLPNGYDQEAWMDGEAPTVSERNSVLLSRCVTGIIDPEGDIQVPDPREFGIEDRRRILSEISKRNPGPRYDETTYQHDCGFTVDTPIGLMHLFPGLW